MNINFALVLLILLLVTGVIWLIDVLFLRKRRATQLALALEEFEKTRINALRSLGGDTAVEAERQALAARIRKMPWWLEYSVSFFPVILVVFVLRSFVMEPFRIPSGSMIPTLQIGDLILVNKYEYGVRLPITNKKVIEVSLPKRGDVVVFKYPLDTSVDYIKRIVGIPGDKVSYINKKLSINDQPVPIVEKGEYFDADQVSYAQLFTEKLGEHEHRFINEVSKPAGVSSVNTFPHRDQCSYNQVGFTCIVPPNSYFAMGDNRDNSLDSRYWGFVPEANIVGRAFMVWMNFGDLQRIGKFN